MYMHRHMHVHGHVHPCAGTGISMFTTWAGRRFARPRGGEDCPADRIEEELMHRRPTRTLVILLVLGAVVLSLVVGAWADAGPHGPATATGTGGAAATVDTLATQAAIEALKS